MKYRPLLLFILLAWMPYESGLAQEIALFNGKTFDGWEGNTNSVWRINNGVIIGGSLEGNPQNEFLATTQSYENFKLRLEYKLIGTEGFVNGGVQIRSQRIKDPPNEMIGYQADIGAGYSGCLYDESRRRRMLATADPELVQSIEKPGEWNLYEIIASGREVQLFLNGHKTVTWVEDEKGIDPSGKIALQIHGNCKAEIFFRNIYIEPLPAPQIPTEGEILSRFGDGQPVLPYPPFENGRFHLMDNEVIVLMGQENFVREQKAGALESLLTVGFVEKKPRFRSMAWEADTVYEQWRDLHFGSWIDQLQTAKATTLILQFGQMEAMDGGDRMPEFIAAYHRLLDQVSGQTRRLVLISPMPFEKPTASHAPDLTRLNSDVAAYTRSIEEIARQRNALFIDLYAKVEGRPPGSNRLTDNGIHLTQSGLHEIAGFISEALGAVPVRGVDMDPLREVILRKNQLWFDCWRPANWSFAYGDRVSQAFGQGEDSHPSLKESFELRRPLIDKLDAAIHEIALGEPLSNPIQETFQTKTTQEFPPALSPQEQLETFKVAEGYSVNLFASEQEGVINPTQIAWDEKGRLYVACSPSYPQSLASEPPGDYIIVLHDKNGDGIADESGRYAEGLRMIQGLEPGPDGLYVCDFDQLLFLSDKDQDNRADARTVLFSGFGIGDTHQLINSISHGPDGHLWFTQGLHAMSLVETPWGIVRLDRAGVWRLNIRTLRLEGYFGGGMAGANCWGVAMDDFGQVFHKTGDRPQGYWTLPGMVRGASPSGSGSRTLANQSYNPSPEQYHSVGPLFDSPLKTTSLDIIGTKALPEEIQGSAVIAGYFGSVVERHEFHDSGSGFRTTQMPRLLESSNPAFRPVDVSMGPDGAIYLADWYNPVIGHYQASYADTRRDKSHGRIWRLSARDLAPVKQPDLASMTNDALLDELRSPERWTRYQAKRVLFYRPTEEVIPAADYWLQQREPGESGYERLLLEVTGIFEAHESPRPDLLKRLIKADDFRVRAYGTQVLAKWSQHLDDPLELLNRCLNDPHPRVRLGAVIASSYFRSSESAVLATQVLQKKMDPFLEYALRQSVRALEPFWRPELSQDTLQIENARQRDYLLDLAASGPVMKSPGEELYTMACLACHQAEGRGLEGIYPSLVKSDWVSGDPTRLVKIIMHGLTGPIILNGKSFQSASDLQMPAMGGLSDKQIADVLTYIRSRFGNSASAISPDQVREIRAKTLDRNRPWLEDEL